ncbi:MAG: hypothetical protein IJU28_04615 [Clostridia bacterium]|nr:hypothetical protein [Clostridia bacterium]
MEIIQCAAYKNPAGTSASAGIETALKLIALPPCADSTADVLRNTIAPERLPERFGGIALPAAQTPAGSLRILSFPRLYPPVLYRHIVENARTLWLIHGHFKDGGAKIFRFCYKYLSKPVDFSAAVCYHNGV